ncbi:DNA-directed RNA polymerase subunit alpha C-terminal domain-containing protein [Actinokineospora sp.]|uniref:DNA-directed RNA polymerase subunit alpha C-terminal domain-containing protein n=1 Tax=Actinokineospora sp. TaxID=1872133 RepID=UPI0040384EB6
MTRQRLSPAPDGYQVILHPSPDRHRRAGTDHRTLGVALRTVLDRFAHGTAAAATVVDPRAPHGVPGPRVLLARTGARTILVTGHRPLAATVARALTAGEQPTWRPHAAPAATTPLDTMALSTRAANLLNSVGIGTVEELAAVPGRILVHIDFLGPTILAQIRRKLDHRPRPDQAISERAG